MKKKSLVIFCIALVGLSLTIFPSSSYAFRHGHHGHGRGWEPGWHGAGAFAGGLILGSLLTYPWYPPPPPVRVYRAPAVVYAPPPSVVYFPNQAYACPDPNYSAAPSTSGQTGQWVDVPGQYVGGKWVPQHKAWVPDNR